MARPRAVMIAPLLPASRALGLAMRMGVALDALCRVADVHLVVLPIAGPAEDPAAEAYVARLGARLQVIPVGGRQDTHFALLSRLSDPAARLVAFRAYGRPTLASPLSAPVLGELRAALDAARPDLIHVGRAYLAPSLDVVPRDIPVCLDFDEDDSASFRGQALLARVAGRAFEADWLEQEAEAIEGLIATSVKRIDAAFVASESEARQLAGRHAGLRPTLLRNAVTIPVRSGAVPAAEAAGDTLLFVGALGYAPNAEGVRWFVREVLPRITAARAVPARLLIAGASPPPEVRALGSEPAVRVLGFVPDLAPLYAGAALALAPLRAGGGTRIKLIEAAAHGVASVATETAARGLEWRAPVGGWRAEGAEDFATACCEALASPLERARRAALGLAHVDRYHRRDRVVAGLAEAFAEALGQNGARNGCAGA